MPFETSAFSDKNSPGAMMVEILLQYFSWIKALHIISVISWMAGLLYLPRLFVYHAENAAQNSELSDLFSMMEYRLLRMIMNPAMIATWVFGLLMVLTPGIVDWSQYWPWVKASAILVLTWFHHWLGKRRKDFLQNANLLSGRNYRIMNELPTVVMVIIVVMVVVRPF